MRKETITYVDYDGNERTEDFYFNLTQAEVVEMEYSETGGLKKTLENIVATQDQTRIVSMFKRIVLAAYGEKSMDGRRFIKSDELRTGFSQTEAYSQLFMKLATDSDYASKFINGIMPKVDEQNKVTPVPINK